jgi:hypothetical protein
MEKIIKIDGKDFRFKSTGAFPLFYKNHFNSDFFQDMGVVASGGTVDSEAYYRIVWTMAKCADPEIPPMLEWFDSFDKFPIFAIHAQLQPVLDDTLLSSKK